MCPKTHPRLSEDCCLCLAKIPLQNETKNEYEKVIQETETAYLKILESSQTLLSVLKREAVNIQVRKASIASCVCFAVVFRCFVKVITPCGFLWVQSCSIPWASESAGDQDGTRLHY